MYIRTCLPQGTSWGFPAVYLNCENVAQATDRVAWTCLRNRVLNQLLSVTILHPPALTRTHFSVVLLLRLWV